MSAPRRKVYQIEGVKFSGAREVYTHATKKRKFKGAIGTIQRRLIRGVRKWDALLAPLRPYGALHRDDRAVKSATKELLAEMAALAAIRPGKAKRVKSKAKKVKAKATPQKAKPKVKKVKATPQKAVAQAEASLV